MLAGTLTPPRDGVHPRGQDRVSQKRPPPLRIPPSFITVSYTISRFVNINRSILPSLGLEVPART